ncbi:MAG: thiazole biosynthesis adenylyltransferase ThiF [Planctomycetes bacterium]|nr:thiazole biosynthesis adenylyltransferase ThiF [Planctomycetota bacterium]
MTHPAILPDGRYARQTLFEPIGEAGQEKLGAASVLIVGCGALGTVQASTLVRAGVGSIRICDRDYIELNNLQRQVLFDEQDIEQNLPKAVAAANKLSRVNSSVRVEPMVTDVNFKNIARLAEGCDLILDGTDNFETRYLINDFAIKEGVPWIYGAVIGATGLVMPILPGKTPCLRCVFENAPPAEMSPTCDTAGVIGPAVNVVASMQAVEAMKVLTGCDDDVIRKLISIDVWSGRVVQLGVTKPEDADGCICCDRRQFEYLQGEAGSFTTTLCGRNAVQISSPQISSSLSHTDDTNLEAIAQKLEQVASGDVKRSDYLVRAVVGEYELTIFKDGRSIIKGTKNADEARSVYAKYIGS